MMSSISRGIFSWSVERDREDYKQMSMNPRANGTCMKSEPSCEGCQSDDEAKKKAIAPPSYENITPTVLTTNDKQAKN